MATVRSLHPAVPCPCGTGRCYADCCAPLHAGIPAATAETLMRSRYSAYALALDAYLLATWHDSTRPPKLDLSDPNTPPLRWFFLQVLQHEVQGESATVEFVARYRINGRAHRLHEISQFVRENGRWFYLMAANETK